MGSRKVLSYPFSPTPANLSLELKEKQNSGYTGTYIYIFALGLHPNSCSVTTLTAQAQAHAKVLAQSESCCRRQPDYTLPFIRLVSAFTFGVDPHLTASPSYPTYPPAAQRVSGIRPLKQNGSFKGSWDLWPLCTNFGWHNCTKKYNA